MFRTIALVIALTIPAVALASGNRSEKPPKPTKTTESCKHGKVWDKKSKACVNAQESQLDDETLYGAVREFAYAGQYGNAQTVLSAMSDQNDDRVLTYWGFTHRKMGDVAKGMAFYDRALKQNPANILARSYMGQALVEQGDLTGAQAQLVQIRAHDGADTWAENALTTAISTGEGFSY